MTDRDTPAFPIQNGNYDGLSKREYFAAMAMQGMMSLPPDRMVSWAGVGDKKFETVGAWVAANCVVMADALIAELNK